ncbi:OB-fold nucleic acid binding domain-containing protein [Methanobacterium spitsbergense]|uniref:Replication protein A n=1 Tax=Methanobacterium spitsbergense TaxID=2874285 RepID=A0A8T5UMV6_9EURY|nr:OB-fold nucleic acid binding domain-containing protein [Methanobacterium spitsbergense]MBZ2164994.1 replication protein A [Methanobacterium spitsbergense]
MSGEEIKSEYEKIKDKISYDDFLKRMEERKHDYEDVSFMSELDIARTIVGEYINEANKPLSEANEAHKISELETGRDNISITGRVMHISHVKKFTSKKGREGKLANMILSDDTGEIRVVLWTENIKFLKKISEGDVIKINNAEVKQGFREDELHMKLDSTIQKLDEKDFETFPKYDDKITNIEDIKGDMQVNVVARILRIPKIRTFNKNGKEGKVLSLEIQDKTGKIQFTLWNRDTDIVEDLELKEGDSIKILGALGRTRDNEVSLSNSWVGRILKGEFDLPEYTETIQKIGDAHEMRDVTVVGVICKIYDAITFMRDDGSTGQVRSLEMEDDTGSIRITLWNDDANMDLKKGDIIKIIGGNIEFDEYSGTDYRINTNWNTKIIINPEIDAKLKKQLQECGKYLKPLKISQIHEMDEEGEEIDVVGRIVNVYDPSEFNRDDGTTGKVRTIEIGDGTGLIRASFWDDKAELSFAEGDPIKIENARTRLGNYNMDLSIGRTARIVKPNPEEINDLPAINEIEDSIYSTKTISELNDGDRNVRLIGRVINIYDPNEFQRADGSKGTVRTIEIADGTGVIRASFWDEKSETPLNVGDTIKIENPRVNLRDDKIELSVGRNTNVTKATDEETEKLPSFDDIKEMIYKTKKIDDIGEEDRNIKVTGQIVEAYGNRILYEMCPNCNKRVSLVDNIYICDICGEEIDEPNYLMIIPCVIEDDTGTMRVTFFRTAAEELIGMKMQEIIGVIQKTGDEGSLEDKVSDLVGHEITIIADASFDEYNEEIRLNAKKLVEMKL